MRTLLEETFRAFPDLTFEVTETPLVARGDRAAAVVWRATGTMTGVLEPPGLAATGRRFVLEGVDLYDVRDGLLARMRTRYDVLDWLRQMGAAPSRGGGTERALLALQRFGTRVVRR